MVEALKKLLPHRLRFFLGRVRFAFFESSQEAYSQEGEDLILQRIFRDQSNGFYVDVGAHHPSRISNTYLFYRRGWKGINIDAMPGSMELFHSKRPRDINVEAAIARATGASRKFWVFAEPAFNTFDEVTAQSLIDGPHHYPLIRTCEVSIQSLSDILRDNLPKDVAVDFLTIDVESLDLEVLQSNDWNLYRPTYVLVECTGVSMSNLPTHPTYLFLHERGYEFFAKTVNTFFFRKRGA